MMRDGGYQTRRGYRRHLSIFICLLLIFVLSTTVAHAISIVVDGDREAAWDGAASISDDNEPEIADNVDIKTFQFTNDNDNFYFLIETWESPPSLGRNQYIEICLDIDNKLDTTIHPSQEEQIKRCAFVEGIDTVIWVGSGANSTEIFNVTPPTEVSMGLGMAAVDSTAATPVVEISVAFSDLGINPGEDCGKPIPMVAYYDGATNAPDDNLPDMGSTDITCTIVPTAVSMHSLSTVVNSPVSSSTLLAGLVLTIVSGGVILRRERRA